jgi:redox-sensitive bicupin YhaK (pirin superfamily)
MPQQQDGLMWGFQLWVNLPAAEKMTVPRYQDVPPEDVPEVILENGIKIRVLVGESHGIHGPVRGIATDPLYLDVQVPAQMSCSLPVQRGHTAFCYVFDGAGAFGASAQTVTKQHLAVFSDGEIVTVKTTDTPVRFLLLAGKPLHEPVARYGPFVMNTREEIAQAIEDFQRGTFLA